MSSVPSSVFEPSIYFSEEILHGNKTVITGL